MFNTNDKLSQFIAKHQGISWLILLAIIILGSYE